MYYPVHLIVELRVSNVQRALLIGVTTEQTKLQWMSLFNAIKYLTASKRKTGKQTNLHQSIACPTRVESWGWIRPRMGMVGRMAWTESQGPCSKHRHQSRMWSVEERVARTAELAAWVERSQAGSEPSTSRQAGQQAKRWRSCSFLSLCCFVLLLFFANERVCLVCVCVRNLI